MRISRGVVAIFCVPVLTISAAVGLTQDDIDFFNDERDGSRSEPVPDVGFESLEALQPFDVPGTIAKSGFQRTREEDVPTVADRQRYGSREPGPRAGGAVPDERRSLQGRGNFSGTSFDSPTAVRPQQQTNPQQVASPMRQRFITRTIREIQYETIPAEEIEAAKKLQEAIRLLNNSKEEAEREKAALTIQTQLTWQFDRDLKQREKELAEVEKRVKTLREQLNKRRNAQGDIIKLRLQTLVNEANGLGFPNGYPTSVPPAGAVYDLQDWNEPSRSPNRAADTLDDTPFGLPGQDSSREDFTDPLETQEN